MNEIKTKVTKIITKDDLSLVEFVDFSMLSLAVNLEIDDEVLISFKPSSVAISKGNLGLLSYSNQIKTNIINLEIGEILTSVRAKFQSFEIESIISSKSAKRLNLKQDDEVTLLIKATDIFLKEKLSAN